MAMVKRIEEDLVNLFLSIIRCLQRVLDEKYLMF
jgi:hypothetical protein